MEIKPRKTGVPGAFGRDGKKPAFTRKPATQGGSSSLYPKRVGGPSFRGKPSFGTSGARSSYSAKPAYARGGSGSGTPYVKKGFAAGKPPFTKTPYVKRGASAPYRGASTSPLTGTAATFAQKAPYRPGESLIARAYAPKATAREARPPFARSAARKFSSAPERGSGRSAKFETSSSNKGGLKYKIQKPKPSRTQLATYPKKDASTSWGEVAPWYDKHLSSPETYHEKVILPNLLRLVDPKKGDDVLDLACGQGYFAKAFHKKGANVSGLDISPELVALANKESPDIVFQTGNAEDLSAFPDATFNKVVIVLAIQNIAHVSKVADEVARVLKTGGEFHVVMNHPAFRIPKISSWNYDEKKKVQYRRLDAYLSESHADIEMHPGRDDSPTTPSFHRPLQYYFKAFVKSGFAVDRFEEWISHKESDSGDRASAENRARKEFPLFLYIRAKKQ